MSKLWKVIKSIFWVMVIVASIFIIISSFNLFGFRTYVVKSGSMEPKIHTGAVVVDRTFADYRLKDVVTYKIKNSKDTVTHRVVAVKTENGAVFYQTKGDANRTPDPDPVNKANVQGKVLFSVPLLGYAIAFMRTLPGLVIFIFIPAVIIISEEIANIKAEAGKIKQKHRAKKRSKPFDQPLKDVPELAKPEPQTKIEPPKPKPSKRQLIQ